VITAASLKALSSGSACRTLFPGLEPPASHADRNRKRAGLDMDEVLGTLQISRSTRNHVRQRHGGPQDGMLRLGRKLWWNRDALVAWLHTCGDSSDIDAPALRPEVPPAPVDATRYYPDRPVARPEPDNPAYSRSYRPSDIYQGIGEPSSPPWLKSGTTGNGH
jgi:hypothetical protein